MVVEREILTNIPGLNNPNPLSAIVRVNDTLYISGTLGVTKNGLVSGGITPETRQALNNMRTALIVKCTVLLSNYDDFPALNKAYAEFFTHNHPARACYQVAKLPMNSRVEVEAVAVVGPIRERAKM